MPMKPIVSLAALALLASTPAAAQATQADAAAMKAADEQACTFARAAGAGLEAIVDTFKAQAGKFPAASRDGLIGQINAQLRGYTFTDAATYRVYELPGYVRLYAVPVATNGKMLFFALTYERYGGEVVLTNFQYADKLENALKVPYVTDPVTVSCP